MSEPRSCFRRDALLVAITAVTSRTPILGRRVALPLALALMLITSSGTSQAASSHAHVGPPYLTPAYVQWAIAKAINYIPLKGGAKLGPFSGALCEGRGSSIRVTDGRWKGIGYRYFLCVMKESSQSLLWRAAVHSQSVPGQLNFAFGRIYRLL